MELSSKILSDIVVFSKYARYLEDKKRRETWEEIVDRNIAMHVKKFPQLEDEIRDAYRFVFERKILPSMRSAQFAGKPIEINNLRMYNCAFVAVDDWRVFSEVMFALLSGVGISVSLQQHHVDLLPEIKRPLNKKRKYLVGDSCEGWADAVRVLMKSYFFGNSDPDFDFSDIRPKGTQLVTSGGRAPGPEPLRACLNDIRKILDRKGSSEKLKPIEAHDIINFISNAVLSGGIRRSAVLSLFSVDDEEMMSAKSGNWFELNPQRARSNNTAVFLRHRVKKQDFEKFWVRLKNSSSGEPAFCWSNDMEWGINPCAEISIKSKGLCNLVEIDSSNIESQGDLENRVAAATLIATLQASYTNFHYLREGWKRNAEKDGLIGVSLTGIASNTVFKYDIEAAVGVIGVENRRVANLIGINPAARLTCVKPSGTASCVLGTSSGIHSYHSQYYIRRMRLNKDEPLYRYLIKKIPKLVEDDIEKPEFGAVVSIPIKSPDNASFRTEGALELLSRVEKISKRWIAPGHVKGSNMNNVSCTVSIKKGEWEEVGQWMWKNKENYTALSVLPFFSSETCYSQMPFEQISKEKYEELFCLLKEIDLSEVSEGNDGTDLQGEQACGSGACVITHI